MTVALTPPAAPDPDSTAKAIRDLIGHFIGFVGDLELYSDEWLPVVQDIGAAIRFAGKELGKEGAPGMGAIELLAAKVTEVGTQVASAIGDSLGNAVADALRDGLADIADAIRNRGKVTPAATTPQVRGVARVR
jgi:hypothetical protein